MLGIKIETGLLELGRDALVNPAQPRDRREQAERAAAACHEQLAIGGSDLSEIVLADVCDDENSGARRIVERRGCRGTHRAVLDVDGAGALLGGLPVRLVLAGAVA